jgi:uncharacterized protein YunC (DUF1805 family)
MKQLSECWNLFRFTNQRKSEGLYIIEGVYVGRSKSVGNRIKEHVLKATKGKHDNKDLQKVILDAINKKGFVSCEYLDLPAIDSEEERVINALQKKGVKTVNKKSSPTYKKPRKEISEEQRKQARITLFGR